MAVSPKQRDL